MYLSRISFHCFCKFVEDIERKAEAKDGDGRTPRFQLSQNFVMPTSKPTPNAKAPAKMDVT